MLPCSLIFLQSDFVREPIQIIVVQVEKPLLQRFVVLTDFHCSLSQFFSFSLRLFAHPRNEFAENLILFSIGVTENLRCELFAQLLGLLAFLDCLFASFAVGQDLLDDYFATLFKVVL